MTTETKKYAVSFSRRSQAKSVPRRMFFDLARRHIVRGKRGGRRDLSRKIDEIAYGV